MRSGQVGTFCALVVCLLACPTDPPIPLFADTAGSTGGEGDTLVLDCSGIPLAAEEGTVDFAPSVNGAAEGSGLEFSVTNLPKGLMIEPETGRIFGTLDVVAGTYDFEVTVVEIPGEEPVADGSTGGSTGGDDAGNDQPAEGSGQCSLSVAPRLAVDLSLGPESGCLRAGESLLTLVEEGTGDGSPISCSHMVGNGNGRMPQGVDVDPDTCELSGSTTDERFGAFAFIVQGEQSGVRVHVPYCVPNVVSQGYTVSVEHSGNDAMEFEPIVRTFDPSSAFSIGMDGDPRVIIADPGVCGASCFYRYSFLRTVAPIADDGFTLEPDGLFQDEMMQTVGFFHELRVNGPAVPAEFQDRPWVLSTGIYYCLSSQSGECADPSADGDGNLELSLIMIPEPG